MPRCRPKTRSEPPCSAPSDTTRIARALEVVRSTGNPLAHWQEQRVGGIGDAIDLHPLVLLPPREWLYERCDRRFGQMIERGAIEEVEALLKRAPAPAQPGHAGNRRGGNSRNALGEWSREEAIARGQQATRNYAKRQYTWFRRQPPQDWPRSLSERCNMSGYFERLYAF